MELISGRFASLSSSDSLRSRLWGRDSKPCGGEGRKQDWAEGQVGLWQSQQRPQPTPWGVRDDPSVLPPVGRSWACILLSISWTKAMLGGQRRHWTRQVSVANGIPVGRWFFYAQREKTNISGKGTGIQEAERTLCIWETEKRSERLDSNYHRGIWHRMRLEILLARVKGLDFTIRAGENHWILDLVLFWFLFFLPPFF